jgi:hypothetical protein
MLSVPEEFAGQMMKCPLCGGTFPTPSLPGAPLGGFNPPAPPPAPPSPEPYSLAPVPPGPTSPPPVERPKLAPLPDRPESITNEPAPSRKKERAALNDGDEPRPRRSPPPELAPGDYKHTFTIEFDQAILTWIPPALLTLVLLLSFFPWYVPAFDSAYSMWECAFSIPLVRFIFYVILFLLAWAVSIASVVFNAGLVPEPPFLEKLGPWRHAFAGGLSVLAFLFLAIAYLEWVFLTPGPMSISMRVAVRVHFLAVVFAFLELWLDSRRKRRAPPPRIELRW